MDSKPKFQMWGKTAKINRYKISYTPPSDLEAEPVVEYANSEDDRDKIAAFYPGAKVTTLNTADIEWFDGLEFDSYDEALRALERGYYSPKRTREQLQADVDYIAIMTGVEL